MQAVVDYVIAQFHAMQPASCIHLVYCARSEFQLAHIGQLTSTFHSVCNPINITASFRNAGIASRLDAMGNPVRCIDMQQYCRLLQPLQAASVSVDAEG
jgi:hypothetical protein